MREVRTQFPRGKVVRERYIVEGLLGQGGFGAVYRVRDRRVKDNVFALKEIIDPNRQQRENFLFEGEILRRLDHPYLPRVYRVFEDEKNHRLYMLMDYIAGPNLERLRLQQPGKRFSLSQALKIMAPIMEAVEYLHTQQPPIIHRDIKPSNLIVLDSGEGSVLVDFGISKEYDEDSTTTAIRHCSPGYGAPEQYVHGTTTQTDIYGLAATFYTLLTGEVPIDALYRITRMSSRGMDPLQPITELVPTLPQGLADALQRAMAISVQDRFATVQEFWEALRVYEEEDENTAEEDTAETAQPIIAETPDTPTLIPPPVTPVPEPLVETHTTGVQLLHRSYMQPSKTQLVGVVALVLLALLSGSVVAFSNVWSSAQHSSTNTYSSPSAIVRHQQTSTPVATAMPTTIPTKTVVPHTPTVTASPPAPRSITYPSVAASYSGTIHNEYSTSTDTSLTLSQMRQDGAAISGYLAVGPGLVGKGTFDGEVTTDNKISFQLPMGDRYLPLDFEGQFQADGSIKGTYCSYRYGACDYNGGGYGSWFVAPYGSQARSSSNQGQVHTFLPLTYGLAEMRYSLTIAVQFS